MKLDSTTVQLVLAVAEEGSISRAADKLNLAVAAASRRITELERQFGIQLFQRIPHGVKITDTGVKLLQHIRQIDNLIVRLHDDAHAIQQGREGRILIAAPKTAVIQFLAKDIARLKQKHPGLTLHVLEENSKIVQQLLRDKVIDVGIYEKTSGFLDLDRYDYRQDHLVLVYSKRHYQLPSNQVSIDDIVDLPLITLGKGSAILTAVQRAYRSAGRTFQSRFVVSGFDTMLALVNNGLGVGLMPPSILEQFKVDSSITWVGISGQWHHRHYVVSVVQSHAQPQALQHVLDVLIR